MDHLQDEQIPGGSNKVPGVTKGRALRGHNFIKVYIAKRL